MDYHPSQHLIAHLVIYNDTSQHLLKAMGNKAFTEIWASFAFCYEKAG